MKLNPFQIQTSRKEKKSQKKVKTKIERCQNTKSLFLSFQVCLHFPARIFLSVFQKKKKTCAATDNVKKATHTHTHTHSHTHTHTHFTETRGNILFFRNKRQNNKA